MVLGGRNGLLGLQRVPVSQVRRLQRSRPPPRVMPRSAMRPELMCFNSDAMYPTTLPSRLPTTMGISSIVRRNQSAVWRAERPPPFS